MNVKLVVVQGKPEGKEIPLRGPKFLIGRGSECHLQPSSELVSRHHCLFIIDECAVTVRDLGSTNGTLLNGKRVHGDMLVYHEDLIQVGPLGFRIVMDCVPVVVPMTQAPEPVASNAQRAAGVPAKSTPQASSGNGANDSSIEHALECEANRNARDADADNYDDTMMQETVALDRAEGQDTKSELRTPATRSEPPEQS